MQRGMNTMPTARRGRTYYTPGAKDESRSACSHICSVLVLLVVFLLPPILLWGSEITRHRRYLTLREALHSDIVEMNELAGDVDVVRSLNRNANTIYSVLPSSPPSSHSSSPLVHGHTDQISTHTTDPQTHITIPGALTLHRLTEYCQWDQIQSERCQTCTRTVSAKDGTTKEEKYKCDCVTQYDYVKTWRNRRISSLGFDQPAGHHNPMRDPVPSRVFLGEHAWVTFEDGRGHRHGGQHGHGGHHHGHGNSPEREPSLRVHLHPTMLSNGVRSQPRRKVDFVPNGIPPQPSFFDRLFSFFAPFTGGHTFHNFYTPNVRYEPLSLLRDTPTSPAHLDHNFNYVGQGGYFFSPYENPGMASNLFKYFMQYMDGSLFDWQIGDLMPSCTAGDVRFRYEVLDPSVVSVLGGIGVTRDGSGLEVLEISPREMGNVPLGGSNGGSGQLGLVHAGVIPAPVMLLAEDSDSRFSANILRLFFLVWCIPASRLLSVAVGSEREMSEYPMSVQFMGTLGTFGMWAGTAWLVIWGGDANTTGHGGGMGAARDSIFVLALGATLTYVAMLSSPRRRVGSRGIGGVRWHAVWCRFGLWAGVPPDWRVEESYAGVGESKPKML